MTTMDREEVVVLTEALIDGAITKEEFARLEKWLKDDPAARSLYLEHCSLDALLRWRWRPETEALTVQDEVGELVPTTDKVVPFPLWKSLAGTGVGKAIAALVIASLAVLFLLSGNRAGQYAQVEASDGSQWRVVGGRENGNGRQTLLITEGNLKIAFASGVEAEVEGPSLFEIRGENEAMMEWGKGSFQVPEQASGYSVSTPWGRVIDLGTSFDLSVSNEGFAEVSVKEGEVEVIATADNRQRQKLLAGESLVMSRTGLADDQATALGKSDGAASPDDTSDLSVNGYQQLIRKEDPVAYWPFNGREGDLITEKGIVKLVAGPRPPDFPLFDHGNTAAFFSGQGMLRIQDRGENSPFDFDNGDEITIEAWVNPDRQLKEGGIVYIVGKGRTDNLAFLKDNQNFSLRLWKKEGQMMITFLFRSAPDGEWEGDYHRWTTLQGFVPGDGWHHVAATYRYGDPDSIRTYQDGEQMAGEWDMGGASSRRPVIDDDELWLGAARGGENANKFTGMVDEVAIYRKILTADQIGQRVQNKDRQKRQ